MIIINDKPGQLCNRLWAYSFFIAYAQKHFLKIYIPNFREYQKCFENLNVLQGVYFNVIRKPKILDIVTFEAYRILSKVLRIISRLVDMKAFSIYIDYKHWTQEQWQFPIIEKKTGLFFLGSWFHIKDIPALLENKRQIVKLLEPAKRYRERVDRLFSDTHKRYDIIVGVHFRRNEYREFDGGAYFFDDDVYRRYIQMMRNLFSRNSVCYFLASDKPILQSAYYGYEAVCLQNQLLWKTYTL